MLKNIMIEEKLYFFLVKRNYIRLAEITKEAISVNIAIVSVSDEDIERISSVNKNGLVEYDIYNSDKESFLENSEKQAIEDRKGKCFPLDKYRLDETVFIISKEENRRLLKRRNVCIIGYCHEELNNMDMMGVDMILEGLDDISCQFIENVYKRHYKLPITISETTHLLIREITVEDLEDLYVLYENEEITKYMEGLYEDREEEEKFTRAYIENMYGFYGYGVWVVVLKQNGKVIGRAGLSNREINGALEVELGYVIGKEYQRKGYAYEACKSILNYAKDELEMESMNCFILEKNIPSISLAEKLDFKLMDKVDIDDKKYFWYRLKL